MSSSHDKPYPPGFENAFRGVSAVENPFSGNALKEVLFDMTKVRSGSFKEYDCEIKKIGNEGEDTTTKFYLPVRFRSKGSEKVFRPGEDKEKIFQLLNLGDFLTFFGGPDLHVGDRKVHAFGHSQFERFSESDPRDLNRKYGVLFRFENLY